MKYLLACFLFFFNSSAFSQVNVIVQWNPVTASDATDTIYYNLAQKLDWNDFKGKPQTRSIAAAITASGYGYGMTMQTRNNKTNIIINVYCFFNKNNSWVKPGMKIDYALTHEQHHFDITYIHACRFVRKLRAAAFTRNNYEELLNQINDETYAELEKMQNDYDGQTKNGQLKDAQYAWNKKIDDILSTMVTK